MSRLKQIKEDYQIKRLNNFKEIKSLIVSIRINPLKTKIMDDVFWLKRSLIWASTYIEYLYMCFFQYIKDTKKTDRTIDHVNGFEFLTRYIKDKEVFEIYYLNEIYHVNAIEDYLRIKETLDINKMEGEGSLILADMMSID